MDEAALGTGTWIDALIALAAQTGIERGQLIGIGTEHADFNWVPDCNDDALWRSTRWKMCIAAWSQRALPRRHSRSRNLLAATHAMQFREGRLICHDRHDQREVTRLIKAIYAKLGVRREAELVAMLGNGVR